MATDVQITISNKLYIKYCMQVRTILYDTLKREKWSFITIPYWQSWRLKLLVFLFADKMHQYALKLLSSVGVYCQEADFTDSEHLLSIHNTCMGCRVSLVPADTQETLNELQGGIHSSLWSVHHYRNIAAGTHQNGTDLGSSVAPSKSILTNILTAITLLLSFFGASSTCNIFRKRQGCCTVFVHRVPWKYAQRIHTCYQDFISTTQWLRGH